MRIEFGDCGLANEQLGAVGYNVRGVQLDGGELKGSIEASQLETVVALRVHASHRLLFVGEPVPGTVPFAFCDGAYFHGDTSTPTDLCGYQKGIRDTHCHWEGDMNLWLVNPALFEANLVHCNANNALERFHSTNYTNLCPESNGLMRHMFERSLSGEVKTQAQIISMLTTLLECGTEPKPWEAEPKNVPMLRQFVQLAHDEAAEDPLSLAEVSQMLHVGKSTLSAACKDTYGMSVIQLMRQVRLEQCRMALIKPGRTTTVRSVMTKYRFTNQNRFAKTYKEAFAELPSETYMRGQGQLKLQGL